MPTIRWSRSTNFFIPAIQESYISAETIINFSDTALLQGNSDPDILALYTAFHPFKVAYSLAYSVWSSLKSSNQGNTLGVTQLVEELSGIYARQWDIAIQNVYGVNTTQYKALLPHHRIDFQSGTLVSRVHAIQNLLTAMGTDASLATIKTNVTTFLGLLTTAIAKQEGQLVTIEKSIESLDSAALSAANKLLFVYGGLITKFYMTPLSIETFFDTLIMQSSVQTVFTVSLTTTKPKKLCGRKMDLAKCMLKCTNSGTSIAYIYYTNGLNKVPIVGGLFIALLPNTSLTHDFIDAGYSDMNHTLYTQNMGVTTADLKIEIVAK